MQEKAFTYQGLSINYVEAGAGQPIIFLHNGSGMWQSWQKQLRHFSKDYYVCAIDWPGCGGSSYPEGDLNMTLVQKVLKAFIAYKNLTNLHVIGNCIGAAAALDYAIQNKENVNKLLLFNMCPGDLIFPKILPQAYVKGLATKPKAKKRIEKLVRLVFNKPVTKLMFPKKLFGKSMNKKDDFYQLYKAKQFTENQAKSRLQLFFNAYTYNLAPIIEGKTIPKHQLVWGKENAVVDLKKLGLLHYQMLGSDALHVIEKSGHLCMYEAPEDVNIIIADYLDE